MDAEKSFKLPITKKEVLVKGYVSGKVDAEYQRIVNSGVETKAEREIIGDKPSDKDKSMLVGSINPQAQQEADQRFIELMVISLDGDSSNVFDRVTDLPKGDVDYIIEQLNDIYEASKVPAEQKKSSPKTT